MAVILTVFVFCPSFGQQNEVVFLEPQAAQQPQVEWKPVSEGRTERTAINFGFLMGGGSIGGDLEFMVGNKAALQFGAGLGSVGCGINYHLKPYINSSFVTAQYWYQGFGENHYASYLGPMFVFRAKKILQIGIGFGTIVSKGPRIIEYCAKKGIDVPSAALLWNIGLYFPL